ncbi:hypothetical protein JFY74_17425 [Pectobacterium carotovorum]|nr:hypothetical protein JFY74_17425 [Pectobacterium carotovorum]
MEKKNNSFDTVTRRKENKKIEEKEIFAIVIHYINVLLTFYSQKSCNDDLLPINTHVREGIVSCNDRHPVSVLFSIVSLTSTSSVMGKFFLIKQYTGRLLTCKKNINYGNLYIRCNQFPPATKVTDNIINGIALKTTHLLRLNEKQGDVLHFIFSAYCTLNSRRQSHEIRSLLNITYCMIIIYIHQTTLIMKTSDS